MIFQMVPIKFGMLCNCITIFFSTSLLPPPISLCIVDPILPDSPYIVISPFDLTGYSNNLDVFWTARTLIGWTFRLQFLSFETEPIFDLLQVGAGLECNHVFDYSFSGSEVPDVITTKDNTLCLYFSSDYSVVSRGFSVNISTIGL